MKLSAAVKFTVITKQSAGYIGDMAMLLTRVENQKCKCFLLSLLIIQIKARNLFDVLAAVALRHHCETLYNYLS